MERETRIVIDLKPYWNRYSSKMRNKELPEEVIFTRDEDIHLSRISIDEFIYFSHDMEIPEEDRLKEIVEHIIKEVCVVVEYYYNKGISYEDFMPSLLNYLISIFLFIEDREGKVEVDIRGILDRGLLDIYDYHDSSEVMFKFLSHIRHLLDNGVRLDYIGANGMAYYYRFEDLYFKVDQIDESIND